MDESDAGWQQLVCDYLLSVAIFYFGVEMLRSTFGFGEWSFAVRRTVLEKPFMKKCL